MLDSMMECSRCRFYMPERKGMEVGAQGICMRYPPDVFPMAGKVGGVMLHAYYPPVGAKNGCGEWSGQGDNVNMEGKVGA